MVIVFKDLRVTHAKLEISSTFSSTGEVLKLSEKVIYIAAIHIEIWRRRQTQAIGKSSVILPRTGDVIPSVPDPRGVQ